MNFVSDVKMAELKISLPEELKQEMEEFPDIEWHLVLRKLLKQELDRLIELKRIVSKSKLTADDVSELSNKVDKSLAQRFKQSLKS